jgi:hypothetical protein
MTLEPRSSSMAPGHSRKFGVDVIINDKETEL